MKVNIQQNENEVVVSLNGELDTVATTNMSEVLGRVTDLASQHLVIDCKDLEYVSSSGLRFFMQNEDVAEIFRLSGFHHIFNLG